MSIFGRIKNRLLGRREEDLGEIRSHVIGEAPGYGEGEEGPMPSPMPGSPASPTPPTGLVPPREEVPEMPEVPSKFEREPIAIGEPERPATEKSYEIMDRLNIIEAQLTAIRSQTETINERLKNMEMRIGRR